MMLGKNSPKSSPEWWFYTAMSYHGRIRKASPKKQIKSKYISGLVGGFNPSEKYSSKWESSPGFGVKIKNVWNHHLESLYRGTCRDFRNGQSFLLEVDRSPRSEFRRPSHRHGGAIGSTAGVLRRFVLSRWQQRPSWKWGFSSWMSQEVNKWFVNGW